MNIVYASDNNFAEILGISMTSLFENNKSSSEIVVYILDDGINEDNKEKLTSIAYIYSRELIFVDVKGYEVPESVQSERWSKSAFTRLFMKQLLPDNISKVLYLDCDILIRNSLEELYNTDVSEYVAASVRDCISKMYLNNLDIDAAGFYCNSGVLLINMEKWNSELFMNFFDKYKNVIKYPDQDIINGVCNKNMLEADVKYNNYTALYDFTYKDLMTFRKPSKYYTETEVAESKKNPVIVHFTTSFLSLRPWVEGCQHPYAKEWLRYKAMTPWADTPLRKDNRSWKKKLAVKIYKFLPNTLAVNIAGLLHAKIVPAMRRK